MKVLALCYYAPPLLTPQAIQIGRQLHHLDAEVTLLHSRDAVIPDGFDQYPDFYERVAPLYVPSEGANPPGLRHRLGRRLLPLYGAVPDGLRPWRRRARRAAMEAIAAERPDVLVSFGMPMTDHLLGLDLARATGLPWLAHFSDPWAGNPHHPRTRAAHALNAHLERRVLSRADRVLFTSERTREMTMGAHPRAWADKAAVLPHAWDMARVPEPTGEPRGDDAVGRATRVVRHLGVFYGTRSPEPLFAALALLHDREPQVLDGVRFELVGPVPEAYLDSPSWAALPAGLVALTGPAPYLESLRLSRDADALLVVDAPSEQPSVFLPSKLVEYVGAGRPVWGITPAGTSADLVAEWAGRPDASADPGDLEGVVRVLRTGLEQLRRVEDWSGPEEVRQRFAPDVVSSGLLQHLRQAVAARAARA